MPSHFCLALLHLAHSSHLINDYWVNEAINDALLWRAIVSYIMRIFIQGIVCKQDMCKNIRISHLTRCDLLQWAMLLNHQLTTNDLKLRDQRCPPEDAGATASNHPPTAVLQKAAQLGRVVENNRRLVENKLWLHPVFGFLCREGHFLLRLLEPNNTLWGEYCGCKPSIGYMKRWQHPKTVWAHGLEKKLVWQTTKDWGLLCLHHFLPGLQ